MCTNNFVQVIYSTSTYLRGENSVLNFSFNIPFKFDVKMFYCKNNKKEALANNTVNEEIDIG